jgi:HPt (histidine-containing phosphotransfer) domain-containing protein
MDDYISKPTDQSTLRDVISRWIEKTSTAVVQSIQDKTADTQSQSQNNDVSEEDNVAIRLNELGEVCGTDVVIECIDLFLEDTIASLNIFEQSFLKKDFAGVAREAHKLKGSAGNMGATRLPRVCQDLMVCVEENETHKIGEHLNQVRIEFRLLVPVYKEFLKKTQQNETALVS